MTKTEYLKQYRKCHRELGLCNDCARPALEGTVYCHIHTVSKRIQNQKHHAKNRAKHIEKFALRYQHRKENGQCVKCGAVLHEEFDAGNVVCSMCRTRASRRRQ